MQQDTSFDPSLVHVHTSPITAVEKAHAIAVLTEWDEFKTYNWKDFYSSMLKPACIFDGRNILNASEMRQIGFVCKGIGK